MTEKFYQEQPEVFISETVDYMLIQFSEKGITKHVFKYLIKGSLLQEVQTQFHKFTGKRSIFVSKCRGV
jgi:hypothetical protein